MLSIQKYFFNMKRQPTKLISLNELNGVDNKEKKGEGAGWERHLLGDWMSWIVVELLDHVYIAKK